MYTDLVTIFLVFLISYLVGSFSFAIIVSRIMALPDPRYYGSGNPGATNVLRSGRKSAALLTLLGDCFKGWISVFSSIFFTKFYGLESGLIAASMIGVFIGHIFPIFFRFQGGKGVATAAGILLGIHPILGGVTISIWLVVAYLFRYSSLAALVATFSGVSLTAIFLGKTAISIAMFGIGLILIVRHRQNIVNLITGRETKIGSK